MQVVYFPEELHARAPSAVGVLCYVPTNEWVSLFDVVDMVRTGENVTIRPASEQEVQRAEQLVILHEIGHELSKHVGALLDHEPPEVVALHRSKLRDALHSVQVPDLVQQGEESEAPVAEIAQADSFDSLPELYAALHCAHIAGNHDDVAQLDAAIQSILRSPAASAVVADPALMPSGDAVQ